MEKIRSCKEPFELTYISPGGDVRICSWNNIIIGNLCENTLEEIWHSPKAYEIRRAFMQGELLGCNEWCCPVCINNTKPEYTPEELQKMYAELPDTPLYISLAYDERCNHACPSCRPEILKVDAEYRRKLDIITKNIEPYLSQAKGIVTNGMGDLFVSTEIVDMLSRLEPKGSDLYVYLETNGVLFKDNWDKIKNLAGQNIMVAVTPNSFDRETYRYLAGKDDLAKFEESMAFITDLKHQGAIRRIRIIMVIQDSNFRQIPDFIQRCIEYDADEIVLRPIFYWFGMTEDEVLYKNVLNPCHPYHKEYLEIIQHPLCQDPRVFDWGFREKQEAIPFPSLAAERQNAFFEAQMQRVLAGLTKTLCEPHGGIKKAYRGKKIYLFGKGKAGKWLLEKLTSGEEIIPVEGFAVSSSEGRPNFYMGYPVRQFDSIENKEDCLFILATTNSNFDCEMRELLNAYGVKEFLSALQLEAICGSC